MFFLHLFLYVLGLATLVYSSDEQWLPKIVWTYWEEPLAQTDQLMLSFSYNHQKMLSGWQLRHINKNNMWEWLGQIAGLKDLFFGQQFQNQDNAKRADLIRLAIMHHYGGVWMDYTMILMQNLDWVLDLKNNDLVKNKNGQNPDIFILYSSEHGDFDYEIIESTKQKFILYPTFQIFFMAAKPGNQFAQDWINYFQFVVKNSYQKYKSDKEKSWLLDYANQKGLKTGSFTPKMQRYFECSIASSVLLQQKQKQLDLKRNKDQPRELAVKDYNIWVMGTGKTAYNLHWMSNFELKPLVNILAQADMQYLKQKNYFPKYFLKIYHQILYYLKKFFIYPSMKDKLICPQSFYIFQNSILYRYLLENKINKFYDNVILTTSYNRNCILPQSLANYQKYQLFYKVFKQKQKQKQGQKQENKIKQINENMISALGKEIQKNGGKILAKIKQMQEKNKKQQIGVFEKKQWQLKQKYQQKITALQQHVNQLKAQIANNYQFLYLIKILAVGSIASFIAFFFLLYMYIRTHIPDSTIKKYSKFTTDQAESKNLFQTT